MSNVFAEHCEWINLGCTASSKEKQNSGDEGFWARHWWVLTQFSPHRLCIWSSRFLGLQRKQICFCCLTQVIQCELAFLFQGTNTYRNTVQAWMNPSNVFFCRWGNETCGIRFCRVPAVLKALSYVTQFCISFLFFTKPYSSNEVLISCCFNSFCFTSSFHSGTGTLRALPQCCSWLWPPL